MKWVTRWRPRVNRTATAWLIRRFIDPGAEIEISIERLGTLRCRFGEPARKLMPSRWPLRPALQKFHGP